MRSRCSPLSLARRLAHTDLSVFCAISRFSNTLSASNTVGFWNLRPMPARADVHRRHPGQIDGLIVGYRLAAVRPGLAGDHVHQRGFAGAVGADHAAQFADADLQRQIASGRGNRRS